MIGGIGLNAYIVSLRNPTACKVYSVSFLLLNVCVLFCLFPLESKLMHDEVNDTDKSNGVETGLQPIYHSL